MLKNILGQALAKNDRLKNSAYYINLSTLNPLLVDYADKTQEGEEGRINQPANIYTSSATFCHLYYLVFLKIMIIWKNLMAKSHMLYVVYFSATCEIILFFPLTTVLIAQNDS